MVDLDARAARLDDYFDAADLDAVWFARPNDFAWLTGGRNAPDPSAPIGVAAAGYVREEGADSGRFRAVAVEDADRLAAEELPDRFECEEAAWHESSLADAVAERSPANAAADFDVPGLDRVDGAGLRRPLSEDDVERYRALCEETAAAVERVCRELSPKDGEHEVASALRITLSSGAMDAPVVRVAGAERARKFGAAPPAGDRLGDYALVSVTTERAGLYASLTRTVAFEPRDRLRERHRAAARVEVSALAATLAAAGDGDAGDAFEEVRAAYAAVGHPDAWRRTPQGGATGFARREWLAKPDATDPVSAPMGYAWTPTIRGARSEDTYLVETTSADGTAADGVATDGEGGTRDADAECLTATPNWPTVEASATDRDLTLERHDILEL